MGRCRLWGALCLWLLVPFACGCTQAQADELRVLSWNVESGGSDPEVIAEQLRALNSPEFQIIALTEVHPRDFRTYSQALGRRYRYVATVTGGDDRMMILFDNSRLALNSYSELFNQRADRLNDNKWHHRSPLVARLYDRKTRTEFLFVLNHLARGDERLRQSQARGLRHWAQEQSLPMIAVGDYNFDYDIPAERGNRAFSLFREGQVWRWVEPAEKVDTNWADEDGDGRDNYPNSILDFVFVAGKAGTWPAASKILVREGDFPDDNDTSDHRPLVTTFDIE